MPQSQEHVSPGPRRRPATGGYARGDEKRTRIIEAAMRRFGEDGYEGASTRQIAQEAGVNPPALQYYFNSKEGLFGACLAHVSDQFAAAMQDVYARSAAVEPGDSTAVRDIFCDLLDAVADFLFETAEATGWTRFFARVRAMEAHELGNHPAKERIEREFFQHCFRLAGLATGTSPRRTDTRLRVLAAMSMVTAFHIETDGVREHLDWPDIRGPRLVQFKAMLRRQAMAALS